MSSERVAIELRGLGKRYRLKRRRADTIVGRIGALARSLGHLETETEEFWALSDVSFNVARGETVGVIGHNGAGKSTLLKILSRVIVPSAGTVRMRGRVASLLEVGTGFHPDLSARHNVYLNGAILGMRRREISARFDRIIDFAGLERFVDEPVKHLSSGMYLRLAFSVAVFLESEILIVDEVLAVGDRAFQDKCLTTIRTAAQSGRTVLFVSHNLDTIRELTPRTIVLEKGRIAYDGTTNQAIPLYLKKKEGPFTQRRPVEVLAATHRLRTGQSIVVREIGLSPRQSPSVLPGGTVVLELLIEAQVALEGLRVLYSFNRAGNDSVMTGFSPMFSMRAGKRLLELSIRDVTLIPGEYDFTISVGRGGVGDHKTEYDAYAGVGRLTIAEGAFGDWHPRWGFVLHRHSEIRFLDDSSTPSAVAP